MNEKWDFPYRKKRGKRWRLQTGNTVRRHEYWCPYENRHKASKEFMVYPYDGDDLSPPYPPHSFDGTVHWYPFLNMNKAKRWEKVAKGIVIEKYEGERRSRVKYRVNGGGKIPWIQLSAIKVLLGDEIMWVRHNFSEKYSARQDKDSRERGKILNEKWHETRAKRKQRMRQDLKFP